MNRSRPNRIALLRQLADFSQPVDFDAFGAPRDVVPPVCSDESFQVRVPEGHEPLVAVVTDPQRVLVRDQFKAVLLDVTDVPSAANVGQLADGLETALWKRFAHGGMSKDAYRRRFADIVAALPQWSGMSRLLAGAVSPEAVISAPPGTFRSAASDAAVAAARAADQRAAENPPEIGAGHELTCSECGMLRHAPTIHTNSHWGATHETALLCVCERKGGAVAAPPAGSREQDLPGGTSLANNPAPQAEPMCPMPKTRPVVSGADLDMFANM
eukprot:TRINITY_DN57895_c0_g1_i1.p1 TRINITY_DN57895_c0_g1~~TRINITY_DN57895_c0_g1_i1.p1  ORF type:complete len:271 (-),score=19.94 TRINITY_DN57895_c0_g1_i1:263-1075(-)